MSGSLHRGVVFATVCVALCVRSAADTKTLGTNAPPEQLIAGAVKTGTIAYQLTTPEELKDLLGPPKAEHKDKDGGMDVLTLEYEYLSAMFGRSREPGSTFVLYQVQAGDRAIDIGENRPVVLRTEKDLERLNPFWGCAGVSLVRLDLRHQWDRLKKCHFDTRTEWPPAARMPEGFDPGRLLETGKDPGLGVRKLHGAGVDGRGVGIAVIDQPLLRDHTEYKEALAKYEAIEVENVPPQMHGSPVCSIAVGKTCGVAPKATLYYYAVPPWQWNRNEPWAKTLDSIVTLNQQLKDTPRIRVVSISLGAFSERNGYAQWQESVKKANEAGILVVTCDPASLRIATLERKDNCAGDNATDYQLGHYRHRNPDVCVPAGNRTVASHFGPDVFTFYRTGGMSWAVPYLAGLAALGFQVDPSLKPERVRELWQDTATRAEAGPVVNPPAFVAAIKKSP